jgi:hypothetical protein
MPDMLASKGPCAVAISTCSTFVVPSAACTGGVDVRLENGAELIAITTRAAATTISMTGYCILCLVILIGGWLERDDRRR